MNRLHFLPRAFPFRVFSDGGGTVSPAGGRDLKERNLRVGGSVGNDGFEPAAPDTFEHADDSAAVCIAVYFRIPPGPYGTTLDPAAAA